MQALLLPRELEKGPAPDAFHSPGSPLLEDLADSENLRVPGDQDVEIAGKHVLQRSELKELGHESVRVCSALEIYRYLEASEVCLVAHIIYLTDLSRFYQLCSLVYYDLCRCGIGDLIDLYDILLGDISPSGPDFESPASGPVDLLHLGSRVNDLASGGKVGSRHGLKNIIIRVKQIVYSRFTDFVQIKAADLACHTDCNACVCRDQDIRESSGK